MVIPKLMFQFTMHILYLSLQKKIVGKRNPSTSPQTFPRGRGMIFPTKQKEAIALIIFEMISGTYALLVLTIE